MKRKLEIGLLILAVIIAIVALFLTQGSKQEIGSSSVPGNEVTIRNVTKSIVSYSIKPYNSLSPPKKKHRKKWGQPLNLDKYVQIQWLNPIFCGLPKFKG